MPGGPLEPNPEEPEPEIPEIEPTPLAWDARLDELGVRLERTEASPAWRLIAAKYQNPDEAGSRHHIDFLALDADGRAAPNVRFVQDWVGRRNDERPAYGVINAAGETNVPIWISFEPEHKNGIIFAGAADAPGDTVHGMGRPHYQHVVFRLTFQWGQ